MQDGKQPIDNTSKKKRSSTVPKAGEKVKKCKLSKKKCLLSAASDWELHVDVQTKLRFPEETEVTTQISEGLTSHVSSKQSSTRALWMKHSLEDGRPVWHQSRLDALVQLP